MGTRNLKLGTKQLLGFAIILIIMVGVQIFTIRNLDILRDEIDEVTLNRLPRTTAIADINLNTSLLRTNQLEYVVAIDEAQKQKQAEILITLLDNLEENLDTYKRLKTDSETRRLYSETEEKLYEAFEEKWELYQDLNLTFFQLSGENKNQEAVALLTGEAKQVFNDLSSDLAELERLNKADALEAATRADRTFRSTRNITWILIIGTALLSMVIAGGLVRYITVPVQQLEQAAGTVAEGNLDVYLDIPGTDEIGNLAGSFNRMTNSLREAREKTAQQAAALRQQNEELERTLRELEATQQQLVMKEKMASLGDLVAGIAHEINNPIGVVNSSSDVARRCVDRIEQVIGNGVSAEDIKYDPKFFKTLDMLKENIDVTLVAGNRVAMLVQSLNNFAGLDRADYQRVHIHEGLDSCLTLIESDLRNRITVQKNYGDIPEIACYPSQLNQAFINVLKNAAHAIEEKGTIDIKTYQEENHIHVKITDTGRGIPQDRLESIFDFGFSADSSRVKMRSGLSAVYQIIQRHHGDIQVASALGKGTTVTMTLPVV